MNSSNNINSPIQIPLPLNSQRDTIIYDQLSRSSINIKSPNNNNWKYCMLYSLIFFIGGFIFIMNYFATRNAFKDNKVVYYNRESVCNDRVQELNECLNKYKIRNNNVTSTADECAGVSYQVQVCYDEISKFNKKCYIYISEFDKCIRDMKVEKIDPPKELISLNCKEFINDIVRCNTNDELEVNPIYYMDKNYNPINN